MIPHYWLRPSEILLALVECRRLQRMPALHREALYKALRPGSEPRFETISRVCTAQGVRLVAQPFIGTLTKFSGHLGAQRSFVFLRLSS